MPLAGRSLWGNLPSALTELRGAGQARTRACAAEREGKSRFVNKLIGRRHRVSLCVCPCLIRR
jgi:hypothetical protein